MNEGEIRMLAELQSLIIEAQAYQALIEGMKAENQQREIEGKSMAYSDSQFMSLSGDLANISQRIRDEI